MTREKRICGRENERNKKQKAKTTGKKGVYNMRKANEKEERIKENRK